MVEDKEKQNGEEVTMYILQLHLGIRPLQVALWFLVRAFTRQDAGRRVLLIMSLVIIMTTKIHSGKTVITRQVQSH